MLQRVCCKSESDYPLFLLFSGNNLLLNTGIFITLSRSLSPSVLFKNYSQNALTKEFRYTILKIQTERGHALQQLTMSRSEFFSVAKTRLERLDEGKALDDCTGEMLYCLLFHTTINCTCTDCNTALDINHSLEMTTCKGCLLNNHEIALP